MQKKLEYPPGKSPDVCVTVIFRKPNLSKMMINLKMNSIFGMFMNHEYFESFAKGFTLTLQETRSIHDSMNIPKIGFITYIYILL